VASLELVDVVKRFGATTVIQGVDLRVEDGEFVVFVGPSGCGKSTLLRMISGLEAVTEGELRIDGRRVNDVSAAERGLAMVFQSYALYPHMTVYQNMAFGLENIRTPRSKIETKVRAAAALVVCVVVSSAGRAESATAEIERSVDSLRQQIGGAP